MTDLTDDELIGLLREAYEVMEPVPQRVLDQSKAAFLTRAHELRQGGGFPVPAALPGQTPGEAAAEHPAAVLPGHQTTATVGEAGASVRAAGVAGRGSRARKPVTSAAAPALLILPSRAVRLRRLIRRLLGRT